tara:strand:+ start:976 stop:1302 length:327 start_codon:yes stop_codon:yes gene_type:complete
VAVGDLWLIVERPFSGGSEGRRVCVGSRRLASGTAPSSAAGALGEVRLRQLTALEQLVYRGRVAVIFSDLNISYAWSASEALGRQRSLQFGANLVIFALAQYAAGDIR